MSRRPLPDDLRATVLGRIRAGHSFNKVAAETGLSKGSVAWIWRAYGDGPLTERIAMKTSRSRHEKWLADRKRGLTTGQIAMKAGVSRSSVAVALRKILSKK